MMAKEISELTTWHVAARARNIMLLDKLWQRDEKQQTAEQLNYKMLLTKGIRERTAWQVAVEKGQIEVLYSLWEGSK